MKKKLFYSKRLSCNTQEDTVKHVRHIHMPNNSQLTKGHKARMHDVVLTASPGLNPSYDGLMG